MQGGHIYKKCRKKGTPFILHRVGLIISSSKPHLACSPDNFVDDDSADDISGTAENKCPYATHDISPVEACTKIKIKLLHD